MKQRRVPKTNSSAELVNSERLKNPEWEKVFYALTKRRGVTVFLGASDTGKTTCLRAAAAYLARLGRLPVAIVDADIGQSTIGPPTTVGLALLTKHNLATLFTDGLPCHALCFVGGLSPVGYLLQTVVATKRLADKALRKGAATVLVDTTGLIGQNVGFQLKLNKIELLEPRHIVALQRRGELEALLSVLSDRPGLTLHRLPVSSSVRTRSPAERYRYRATRLGAYFGRAERVRLKTEKLTVLSPPAGLSKLTAGLLSPVVSLGSLSSRSLVGHLLGLNNSANETLALGLLEGMTRHGQEIDVLTPLRNLARVRIIQMANIRLAKTGGELETGT
jgi:polynucleotide 5'-kinase involved in rRNA processing